MDDKPNVHIENWAVLGDNLYGEVVDHPRFDPYTEVKTSSIIIMPKYPKQGGKIETRNTIYILGKAK